MTITRLKPWWRRWYVAWSIALVVGAIVAPLAALRVPTKTSVPPAPQPSDRSQAAIAALRTDHFYVGPELAYRITPSERAQIIGTLKSAKAPAYLVFWSEAGDSGTWISDDALAQIMPGVGIGHYALVDERQRVSYDARGMTNASIDSAILQQRLGKALIDYARAMAAAPAEAEPPPFDYMGGPGGGIAAGVLIVGFGYPVLLLVMAIAGATFRRITP